MVFASFAISTWRVLSGIQRVSVWSYANAEMMVGPFAA